MQVANQANNQSLTPSTDMTDTTYFDSEDDYCAGCWSVNQFQQQAYSGLHSPRWSYSTYLLHESMVKSVCNITI